MEKVIKGYVFRLYPSEKQIELIEKSFGCSRYIYNYFLDKNKNYINTYESIKDLRIRKWECLSCTSINERDIRLMLLKV